MGTLIDRVHRELTETDLARIVNIYHAWRGDQRDAGPSSSPNIEEPRTDNSEGIYANVPGFCHSAELKEIASHGYVLTPGRYVGAAEVEDDGEPFEEKMPRLVAELHTQFAESAKLEQAIRENLADMSRGD